MKKLIKFILSLVVILILIVVVPLVILFITIQDSTDNAPVDLYNESITVENQIDDLLLRFTDNKDDNFYLSFSEKDLNLLVFALVKENYNEKYYKATDGEKYIESFEIPEEVFLIGGKEAQIKHIYAEIEDDGLTIYITIDAFSFKTNISIGFNFEKDDMEYKIIFNRLALGGLNLMSGIGKSLLNPILKMLDFTEEKINANIEEKNIPVKFNMDDFSFTFRKEDLGELIKSQLGDESNLDVVSDLVGLVTSSDNNLLDIGLFELEGEKHFGFKLSLAEIKNSEAESTRLNQEIDKASVGFNQEVFIANKTQNFLISNLVGTEQKITFTNLDFNKIIYSNTNGYAGFSYPELIDVGEVYIFNVKGILFEFKITTLDIIFVIEINGIETKLVLTGDVVISSDEKTINIVLRDTLKLQSISSSANFILNVLKEQMDDFGGISYDANNNAFIISTAAFEDFMSTGGGVTPLSVEKIRIINGGIEVVVKTEDLGFAGLISTLTDSLETTLQGGLLDTSGLNSEDPGVETLNETLEEIEEALSSSGITEDLANQLINDFNNLTQENQAAFISQIEGNLPDELADLYADLFGK